jgi:hypothetical protein
MNLLSRLFGKKTPPPSQRHGGGDMVSLVALLPSWQELTVDEVRESLDALFPGAFLPPREEGNFVIEGPVPGTSYLIQCTVPEHTGMFLMHNVPGPYSEFSDYLTRLVDPVLRELAAKQPCWMSVDLMHRHTTHEDGYRFVSAALAKLAPSDTAVLLHPSRYVAVPFTVGVRRTLASGGSPYGNA